MTFEQFVQKMMSDPAFSDNVRGVGKDTRANALNKAQITDPKVLAAIDKVFGAPGTDSDTIKDLTSLATLMKGGPNLRN
jgi:hypothetical protein